MKRVTATQLQAWERRNAILKYIREHGPVDLTQVCDHFGGWPRSSTREWLADMGDTEHIEIVKAVTSSGSTKNIYQHGDNVAPLRPARDVMPKPESKHLPWEKCNRRVVPAKQIGIARDEMIAAFFGPAVAA